VLSLLSGGPKLNPALVIHGGPGLSSAYLESLELLAADGRQIIFYDQVIKRTTRSAETRKEKNKHWQA
jgi:hypothetical protein